MTEVKQMYRITRFVDSDKYDPTKKELKNPLQAIEDCAKSYASTKSKLSLRKAHRLVDNTLDHKYVEVIGNDDMGHFLRVTSGRGRQLISKTWLVYRKGLKEQTMKEYPQTQAMYKVKYVARVGAVGTILGGVIGSVATYILTHH